MAYRFPDQICTDRECGHSPVLEISRARISERVVGRRLKCPQCGQREYEGWAPNGENIPWIGITQRLWHELQDALDAADHEGFPATVDPAFASQARFSGSVGKTKPAPAP